MKNERIEGIDFIRAIMPVFVVTWHMEGAGKSAVFSKEKYHEHAFAVSDLVNFHILLLAVPVFILVSNYLYALRGASIGTLGKRFRRILVLLGFWPAAYLLFKDGYQGLFELSPESAGDFIVTILRAGHTVYYFFVSLIFSLLATYLIARSPSKCQMAGFVLSIAAIASLPLLTKMTGWPVLSAFWNPLNFVPFSFAAVLLARNEEYVRLKKRTLVAASIALFVLFSVLEWNYATGAVFFQGQGSAIPAYTRASLLFGAIVILIPATDRRVKSNGVIRYMARYSLALYCLHPFVMGPVTEIVDRFVRNDIVSTYLSILLVILISYQVAQVLRIFLREKVLT